MKRPAWVLGACAMVATLSPVASASARSILFVGNSFTFGAGSPVRIYHPERVRDVNGTGMAGVPALFKTFADEMGLVWEVAMEASPGRSLEWHYTERKSQLRGRWDVVLLQGYSTLDREHPGDPTQHLLGAHHLVNLLRHDNPGVQIDLVSTWSRADQTYRKEGGWYGQPIFRMAEDIAAASARANAGSDAIRQVVPVGLAWNRAMRTGIADPDPYDGTAWGKVDLWSWDQYHASTAGYYLEALVEFGLVTGVDPLALGRDERAAEELGLSPNVARALQQVAHDELVATGARLGTAERVRR